MDGSRPALAPAALAAVSARPRTRLGRTLDRLAATEYLTVGRGRRYRAVQRRRTRTAARVGFLVVAAAVGVDAIALVGIGTPGVRPAIALDVLILVAALAGTWLLPRRLARVPEATAFAITMGVGVSTVVTGLVAPTLTAQTVGYLILIPGLIALLLPWRTTTHLIWLAGYAVVAASYLIAGPSTDLSASERNDLMVVMAIALGASVAGHVLLQHGQIRAFAQLERNRVLRRRIAADHRELELVHRELERTARIDPLTGAGNRRRLHEDLQSIRSHIDRSGATYGLMELDLDNFKGINDQLGHLAGDDVLRRVVEAVQRATRASDAVYRYGGEEFLVILPMADRAQLIAAAERLRAAVLELGIAHPANSALGVVSVSIGATLITDDTLQLSDEQWFWVVDRALYAAKAGGRNQVRIATGLAA